jgi:hypothetical protein
VETLLNPKQTTDLISLLATVSVQARLGSGHRGEADYWAGQIESGLDADDMQRIAWLLEDVAASPLLPDPIQQWAKAWTVTIDDLTGRLEVY